MRIPVLLIAGLIALGPAAHAAEAPSANEAPPAAVTAPPPAPLPAGQENAVPGASPASSRRPRFRAAPRRARGGLRPRGGPPSPAPAPEATPVRRRPAPGAPSAAPVRAGSRPIPGPRGPIPHVPVDGLHRRRPAGPHQVHERADEEELHLRRAGAGEDHDHLPPPGNAGRGVRRLPLRAAVEGVHHRFAGEHDQDHRRAGSAPGLHPHRRLERNRLPRSSSPASFRCRTSRAPRSSRWWRRWSPRTGWSPRSVPPTRCC